jgi:hypothetical protein
MRANIRIDDGGREPTRVPHMPPELIFIAASFGSQLLRRRKCVEQGANYMYMHTYM